MMTRAVTSTMKRGNHRIKPHCTKTAYSVFVQITQLGRRFTIVINLNNYVCKIRQVPVKQQAGCAQKDGVCGGLLWCSFACYAEEHGKCKE